MIQVCVSTLKFTLFRTFKNIIMDLIVQNIDFAQRNISENISRNMSRKNISNKSTMLGSDRKKTNEGILLVCRKRSCLKESGVTTQERREMEQALFCQVNIKTMLLPIKFSFLLFLVNNNYYFLLANADLLRISVFLFLIKHIYRSPNA